MASWTDKELTDAAHDHAKGEDMPRERYEAIVAAFQAGAVWGQKQEPKDGDK